VLAATVAILLAVTLAGCCDDESVAVDKRRLFNMRWE